MKVSGRTGNHVVFRMKLSDIKPSAVVLCLTATGLTVARSLGGHGVEVYGVDPNRYEIGHFSKYVRSSRRLSCVAEGFFHGFSGWFIFMFSLGVLLGEMWVLKRAGSREQGAGSIAKKVKKRKERRKA